jgi:hypothetical protein
MIGTVATTWQVNKTTRRHDARFVGTTAGWVGGIVTRNLALTGKGYLVERDAGGVVSCKRLADLFCVVRHPRSSELTLEFSNGSSRTYTSSNRDALLVSILDAAATLGKNTAVHVSDVMSSGYCLASLRISPSHSQEKTTATSLFQPISIPLYCLKHVHSMSTKAYAFVSREFEVVQRRQDIDLAGQCQAVVEACREFNASVPPTGEGLPTGTADKYVSGSIGALWGLVAALLGRPPPQGEAALHNVRESSQAEATASTFLQTLCILSKSPAGYKLSAELSTLQEAIPLLWAIDDVFCKFWSFQVLNVLLSGLPRRDAEAEYVNKSVILSTGGQQLVQGLVSAMVEPSKQHVSNGVVSDLVLMVASDILQSLLCSFHDTTSPENFGAFISALADR